MSLSPLILSRLHKALAACPMFQNNALLLTVFNDSRLAQYKGHVPQTDEISSRIGLLVDKLMEKWDTRDQNGLVLFLCVLGERTQDPKFGDLAEDLRQELIQEKIKEIGEGLDQVKLWEDQRSISAASLEKERTDLQNKLRKWEAEKAKPPFCQIASPEAPTPAQSADLPQPSPAAEHYTDLEIHISRSGDEGCYAVTAELDGEGKHNGAMQMGEVERQRLLEKTDPAEYGLALYDALFTGEIVSAYTKACERARTQNGDRLRLRLWIDHNAADLHALIWERLHDRREGGAFRIAADAKRPFSRYFGLQGVEAAAIAGKARMLCVLSSPQDLADHGLKPLDGNVEIGNLLVALKQLAQAGIAVTVMPGQGGLSAERQGELKAAGCAIVGGPSTLDGIFEQLAYAPGHDLVHFIGHGIFNARRDRASLVLEDKAGQVALAADADLAGLLAGLDHKPHLIFLAACESAARSADSANPFVGLAPRLVQIGIPAVIAMQSTIEIEQAQKLTQHFYRFLLEHGVADKALNQARGFLASGGWDVPVLFMRLREGRLIKRT